MAGGHARLPGALALRSPRSYVRVGVVVAVLAGVLVVTSAGAYTSTRFLTGDQSAWLQKGRTIAQINGPSGRFETTASDQPVSVAGSASDPLQVVQTGNGQVYTVDPRTHMVYEVDPNTGQPQAGPAGTQVLADASDRDVFVLDAGADTLTPVDPATMGSAGAAIRIPGPVNTAAIDDNGTVYVGNRDGTVTTVAKGKATTRAVGGKQDDLYVSVVNNEPVSFDPQSGAVDSLADTSSPIVTLQGNAEAPVELATSQPAGRMWLVWGDQLIGVDLSGNDAPQQAKLNAGTDYGAPVTNDGMVYVADDTDGKVLVFNPADDLAQAPAVTVPAGQPGDDDIEVVVKDGGVWVDNPTSQDGKLIAGNSVTTIDKGTGDGVVNPNAENPNPKPAPAQTNPNPSSDPSTDVPPSDMTPSTAPPLPDTPPVTAPDTTPTPTPTVTVAPITLPTTPPPTPTVTKPTDPLPTDPTPTDPQPTPPPTTDDKVTVPTPSSDETTKDYCAAVTSAGLTCTTTYQATAAPSGKPDVVVSEDPAAGQSETKGTQVTVTADDIAVPQPNSQDYSTYCATVDADGFDCSPDDKQQGPAGSQANQVFQATDAGQLEPPGTTIDAEYYSSAATPMVAVPSCPLGQAPSACGSASGISQTVVDQASATGYACNTTTGQDPAAGTQVAEGATYTVYVDTTCAAPLYEFQHTNTTATPNPLIHFLSFTNDQPAPDSGNSDWMYPSSAGADAYQPQGSTCPKDGTEPVYRFEYPSSSPNAKNSDHWYFTTNAGFDDAGWSTSSRTVAACVFGSQVAGTEPIYATFLNSPTVPGDYSWSPTKTQSDSSVVWYQPTS